MIEFTEEDDELLVWIEEYGCVTSYSFMIYSPMTIKDNCIVNKGLTMIMMHNNLKDTRYIQIIDEFDKEKAELFGTDRGWNVQWVFPGDMQNDIIENTIKEGLTHLKLRYEFYGIIGGKDV